MSLLGQYILRYSSSIYRCYVKKNIKERPSSIEEGWIEYILWQFNSSPLLFQKYPHFDLRNKRVLDIGCGTGGRSAYLATQGIKEVVAIDINREEIEIASRLCTQLFPETSNRVAFKVVKEDECLNIGKFDIVLLVDSMEHVVSPPQMLKLASQYLKEDGKLYFSNIGWYNHEGSHMGLLPWDNLLFSDETILNVYRWYISQPDYIPTRFDSDPPVKRWQGIYNLRDRPGEHLNKITIREIKKLIQYSDFTYKNMTICGFRKASGLSSILNVMRHIPYIQEVFHSYIIVELCL